MLTTEYCISHVTQSTYGCQVKLEVDAGLPLMAETNMFLGYNLKRVSASMAFGVRGPRAEGCLYSVFLETL